MLHFDDLSLMTVDEEEIHPGLIKRSIEVTHRMMIMDTDINDIIYLL